MALFFHGLQIPDAPCMVYLPYISPKFRVNVSKIYHTFGEIWGPGGARSDHYDMER